MFLAGGRMRTALLLVILLSVTTGCGGKKKKTAESSPAEGTENPITADFGQSPAQGDVRRGAERLKDENALKEIAQTTVLQLGLGHRGRAVRQCHEAIAAA